MCTGSGLSAARMFKRDPASMPPALVVTRCSCGCVCRHAAHQELGAGTNGSHRRRLPPDDAQPGAGRLPGDGGRLHAHQHAEGCESVNRVEHVESNAGAGVGRLL